MGALLSSLPQASADPSQRLMSVLPPLGGQLVQFGQGLPQKQILPACILAMSAQGGFHFGLFGSGANALFQGLFIDMSSFASTFIGDSGIEGVHIEGAHIEGAHIEGAQISGAAIEGAPISAPSGGNNIMIDAPRIESPRLSAPEIAAATSIRAPSV